VVATHDFNDRQVDTAIGHVISHGARDGARTVPLAEVFASAGLLPPWELHLGGESDLVIRFMTRFHDRCVERALPPLDSLVVHDEGARRGRPGATYFLINGHDDPFGGRSGPDRAVAALAFWQAEVRRCREWGRQSGPTHDKDAT